MKQGSGRIFCRFSCPRCRRPSQTCICATIQPLSPSVQFVILLHPKERRKTVGTARMAHLFLSNSRLIHGFDFSEHGEVSAILGDPRHHCVVLYPGQNATHLSAESVGAFEHQIPKDRRLVVFIIDGTWHCASRMMLVNPRLAALPQICFSPQQPSGYQFRRQPHDYCVSTIEAIIELLKILEPQIDHAVMTQSFQTMVRQQSSFTGEKARQRLKVQK